MKREPVFRDEEVTEFHHFVNPFVELDGMPRFKDDVEWRHLLMKIRDGTATVDDRKHINEHCMIVWSSVTRTNQHQNKVFKL